MYIPTQFYNEGGVTSPISASGGDTISTFTSGSTTYKYHEFSATGSASFEIHSGSSNNVKVLVVAGGGAGGFTESNGDGNNESAGGGGAGGVVYTTITLGQGLYNLYVGDGVTSRQQEGEDSWLEVPYLPSNYQSYSPTGSRLTAEGGGYGAYFLNINNVSTGKVDASAGGSGGGGCASLRFVGGYTVGARNGGRIPQGNNGGIPNGTNCESTSETSATGGGGALEASSDVDCTTGPFQEPGGQGQTIPITGTNVVYGRGGGSIRKGTLDLASGDTENPATRAKGSGGHGDSESYTTTYGVQSKEGIVIIMYPQ